MRRQRFTPRRDWQQRCEAVGFGYHSMGGVYWDESVAYEFTLKQILALEAAMESLNQCCLETVAWIVDNGHFEPFHLSDHAIAAISHAWRRGERGLYGRFDFSWDGKQPAKLLEYNADTPTSLLEASVVQWFWVQDVLPNADQFNSIHEKLIEAWAHRFTRFDMPNRVHFCALADSAEDQGNALYMMDTACQAGLDVSYLDVEAIGFDPATRRFVDEDMAPISHCFKLYPWEWLWRDDFGAQIAASGIRFIEPAWKLLLSSKAILPLLWQRYPGHPNLLPASFCDDLTGNRVRKPIYSREGENIGLLIDGQAAETPGHYGDEPVIYQAYAPLARFGDVHTVIGGWMVDDRAAGMGIREDSSPVTRNSSRFVPHYFV